MYLQVAFLIKTLLMLRHLSVHSLLKKWDFFCIKESLNRKIIEKVTYNYILCAICGEQFLWENELQVCKCKKCQHWFHLSGVFHLERTLNLGWGFQRSLKGLGGIQGKLSAYLPEGSMKTALFGGGEEEKEITPRYSA